MEPVSLGKVEVIVRLKALRKRLRGSLVYLRIHINDNKRVLSIHQIIFHFSGCLLRLCGPAPSAPGVCHNKCAGGGGDKEVNTYRYSCISKRGVQK